MVTSPRPGESEPTAPAADEVELSFRVDGSIVSVRPHVAVVAGFTGRDPAEVRHHIEELRREGVTPPATVPAFYLLPPDALSQASTLRVVHGETSGEVEIALVATGDERLVTVASDHTDRRAETTDIALSKQVCAKVLARDAWRYEEVADHWDELRLVSWTASDGRDEPYQDGSASRLLRPQDLLARLRWVKRPSCFVLLTGTVPTLEGLRPASRFSASLLDPVLDRSLTLEYHVSVLDVLGPADG